MPEMETVFEVHAPEMVHPSRLVETVFNPNKMSPQEYEALKKSIQEHGFVEPVVVQKSGMRIIGGHHRVRAIKELAIEAGVSIPEIPCVVLDIADAAAKRLNLKLQHIHGKPDARLLGELLIDIFDEHIVEEDALSLGLGYDDALKHMRLVEPEFQHVEDEHGQFDINAGFGRSITLSLEFETVKARDMVKALISERVTLMKKKSGDVVAEALASKKSKTPKQTRKLGKVA